MKSTVPDGEPITRGGLVALEAELAELEGAGRRAIAQRILAARELGDLSENAEYHIAKEEQAHLETRIKRLRQRRRDARVVETDAADATLSFGRGAEVIDELPRISCPTLVMTGERDVNSTPAMARAMHERIRGSRLVILPRYRHSLLIEAGTEVVNELRAFLKESASPIPRGSR